MSSIGQKKPAAVVKRRRTSKFVEIFRTTPVNTVCPNFYVLAHANGCGFDPVCSYCYLKSSFWYLKQPHVFTNVEQIEAEVRRWIGQDEHESYVLNTGNLSDSLTFEDERPLVGRLVQLFRTEAADRGRPHCLLLVTKGGMVECRSLLAERPCANVIVSFSINQAEAAAKYERGAATTADRLTAAKRLIEAGWRVRVRIDPMLLGFEYGGLAEQVRGLPPERLTLGTLRAESNLMGANGNGIFADLEQPEDAKGLARYPREARMGLYRPVVEAMRGVCPIGLCEETPDVWEALGLDVEAKSCNCGL